MAAPVADAMPIQQEQVPSQKGYPEAQQVQAPGIGAKPNGSYQ
jgi:hypothetical protein